MLSTLVLVLLVIEISSLANFRLVDRRKEGAICGGKRIVGGSSVKIEDFPHQLSLGFHYSGSYKHFCGASIISKTFGLTAAHCYIPQISPVYIRAGGTIISDYKQELVVKKFIVHEKYNASIFDYDIALIKPEEPFKLGPTIQPIKLIDDKELPAKEIVYVTGWGNTKENGKVSKVLQYVELDIKSKEECKQIFTRKNLPITDRMICTYKDNKDACQSDSGGPLVCKKDKQQVGVVSWGLGCARKNIPGVFTNIANLRKWIKEKSGI